MACSSSNSRRSLYYVHSTGLITDPVYDRSETDYNQSLVPKSTTTNHSYYAKMFVKTLKVSLKYTNEAYASLTIR